MKTATNSLFLAAILYLCISGNAMAALAPMHSLSGWQHAVSGSKTMDEWETTLGMHLQPAAAAAASASFLGTGATVAPQQQMQQGGAKTLGEWEKELGVRIPTPDVDPLGSDYDPLEASSMLSTGAQTTARATKTLAEWEQELGVHIPQAHVAHAAAAAAMAQHQMNMAHHAAAAHQTLMAHQAALATNGWVNPAHSYSQAAALAHGYHPLLHAARMRQQADLASQQVALGTQAKTDAKFVAAIAAALPAITSVAGPMLAKVAPMVSQMGGASGVLSKVTGMLGGGQGADIGKALGTDPAKLKEMIAGMQKGGDPAKMKEMATGMLAKLKSSGLNLPGGL